VNAGEAAWPATVCTMKRLQVPLTESGPPLGQLLGPPVVVSTGALVP
jgi:hypothetical protein